MSLLKNLRRATQLWLHTTPLGPQTNLKAKIKFLTNFLGPAGGVLLRTYASARNHLEDVALALQKTTTKLRVGLGGKENELVQDNMKKTNRAKVNLGKALKTLVHVHGIQFMDDKQTLLLLSRRRSDPLGSCLARVRPSRAS